MKEFEYPSIYEFPPFFTKQPNADTWAKQLDMWTDLILSYCKFNRLFVLPVDQNQKPFSNSNISRTLGKDVVVLVLDRLVSVGRGVWSKDKSHCIVYWYTPEEWAAKLYQYVFDSGKTNTVCTLYELIHGDEVVDEEFYEADEGVIKSALDVLVKQGKATLFTSTDGAIGIKFQ
ncbi:vacuolar protein-sorting-associated protein 25-like protein [Globomyces pollinis-pini]|nr:vacuolar protein-sorting-associated protein 25-like protein [Globomyces pollinis-pini]